MPRSPDHAQALSSPDPRVQPLRGKHVLLGVCGGIAAYKAAELVRLLKHTGAEVQVVMTRAAQEFISPLTMQTLSGRPVATELFSLTQESDIGHIKMATDADLLIIAPATADVIARLAVGRADDILTTLALVVRAPLILAPAMNVHMWEHPQVAANVQRIKETYHALVVGPEVGDLACRMTGPGRLVEPADLVEVAGRVLTSKDWSRKKILITAGPTREALDPVRYLTNRSSGKMGIAFACAASARGADVTLVLGPTSLSAPMGVNSISVTTAAEMHDAVIDCADTQDVVILAAAVADYRPAQTAPNKIKKQQAGQDLTLSLQPTQDILTELVRRRKKSRRHLPFLVGFAAETENLERNAQNKLATKGCDLIIANDVSRPDIGFDADQNHVCLLRPNTPPHWLPLAPKTTIAHQILDAIREANSVV